MARKLFLLVLFATFAATPALAFRHLLPGQEIPGLSLTQLTGEELQIASKGEQKATLVVFWASWSPRSGKALADCQELYGKYGASGLRVVGVNVEQETPGASELSKAATLAKAAGVTYPLALDRGLSLYGKWGVIAVPSAVLVDGKGRVVEVLDGYAPGASVLFRKRVQQELGAETLGQGPTGSENATVAQYEGRPAEAVPPR